MKKLGAVLLSVAAGSLTTGLLCTTDAEAAPKTVFKVSPEAASAMVKDGKVTLKNGKTLPLAQFEGEVNRLEQWLEHNGETFAKGGHTKKGQRNNVDRDADEKAKRAKSAFAAKLAALRARRGIKPGLPSSPSGGGAAPTKLWEGTGGSSRLDASGSDAQALTDFGPAVKKDGAGPTGAPSTASGTTLSSDPLSDSYEESLGNTAYGAVFVSHGMKNSATATSVGCSSSSELGVYIFGSKLSAMKVTATSAADGSSNTLRTDLYVLGKDVQGWPSTSAIAPGTKENMWFGKGSPKWSNGTAMPSSTKIVSPPEVEYDYSDDSSISIHLKTSSTAAIGISLEATAEHATTAAKAKCTLRAEPQAYLRANAEAQVALAILRATAFANLTFMDFGAPSYSTATLKSAPLALHETVDLGVKAKFLDGDLGFRLETSAPLKGEKIWENWDWDEIYERRFVDWDGFGIDCPNNATTCASPNMLSLLSYPDRLTLFH